MTGKIDYTSIETNSYENIFSVIDNRDNVADPRDPNGTRKFVYDKDPSAKGMQFGNYPYIIVKFPEIEYDKVTSDGKHKEIMWTIAIISRTTEKGANNNSTTTGRRDMLAIGDDLNQTFNSISVQQTLTDWNIKHVKLTKIRSENVDIDEEGIYEAEYELSFKVRLQVSE